MNTSIKPLVVAVAALIAAACQPSKMMSDQMPLTSVRSDIRINLTFDGDADGTCQVSFVTPGFGSPNGNTCPGTGQSTTGLACSQQPSNADEVDRIAWNKTGFSSVAITVDPATACEGGITSSGNFLYCKLNRVTEITTYKYDVDYTANAGGGTSGSCDPYIVVAPR